MGYRLHYQQARLNSSGMIVLGRRGVADSADDVPKVPTGYLREASSLSLFRTDGKIDFELVDVESFRTLPPPIDLDACGTEEYPRSDREVILDIVRQEFELQKKNGEIRAACCLIKVIHKIEELQ